MNEGKGSELEGRVKAVLSDHLNFPVEKIALSSLLSADLGLDSFTAIELMFSIESEFGVKISQEEIGLLKTVGDIVSRVRDLTGEGQG